MIPVQQTILGAQGNCWPACLASILEIKISDVPNFCVNAPDTWFKDTCDWLHREHKMGIIEIRGTDICGAGNGYGIAIGLGWRGLHHAVVTQHWPDRWMIVHDPHPHNDGLDAIKYIAVLTPYY